MFSSLVNIVFRSRVINAAVVFAINRSFHPEEPRNRVQSLMPVSCHPSCSLASSAKSIVATDPFLRPNCVSPYPRILPRYRLLNFYNGHLYCVNVIELNREAVCPVQESLLLATVDRELAQLALTHQAEINELRRT